MRRLPFVYAKGGRACKPNLVCPQRLTGSMREGHHLSGTTVAGRLKRPTCTGPRQGRDVIGGQPSPTVAEFSGPVGTVLLGLAPRGVCLAALVAKSAGALLPHPFTPYHASREAGGRDCSLLHVPSTPCRLLPAPVQSSRWEARGPAVFGLSSPPVPMAVGTDGAMTWHARPTLINVGCAPEVRGRGGFHAKKRSGSNCRLRFYRSTFSFISSTVSL